MEDGVFTVGTLLSRELKLTDPEEIFDGEDDDTDRIVQYIGEKLALAVAGSGLCVDGNIPADADAVTEDCLLGIIARLGDKDQFSKLQQFVQTWNDELGESGVILSFPTLRLIFSCARTKLREIFINEFCFERDFEDVPEEFQRQTLEILIEAYCDEMANMMSLNDEETVSQIADKWFPELRNSCYVLFARSPHKNMELLRHTLCWSTATALVNTLWLKTHSEEDAGKRLMTVGSLLQNGVGNVNEVFRAISANDDGIRLHCSRLEMQHDAMLIVRTAVGMVHLRKSAAQS